MKIKKVLVLTTAEQQKIEDFGNLVIEICDNMERERCKTDCIFKDFCNFDDEASKNFLKLLAKEFNCNVNSNFED